MTRTIKTTDFRTAIRVSIDAVEHRGERLLLERHGEPAAAVVSVEDLHLLEALEDHIDVARAKEALAEDSVGEPLDDVLRELGI